MQMTQQRAVEIGYEFARRTGWTQKPCEVRNFGWAHNNFIPLSQAAADYVYWGLSKTQKAAIPWLKDWTEVWAELQGDFLKQYELDPAITYVPIMAKHQAFHDSLAYIRYFMAGNGCGKTSTGFMEIFWCITRQRHWAETGGNSCIVGVSDKSWGTQVFQPKWLYGEPNNPLSPLLGEDGRWFKRFNQKDNYVEVGCPECASKLRSKYCTHSTKLFVASSQTGWEAIQGGSFMCAQIDEHAEDVKIYEELRERTRRPGVHGRIIVTATPLFGENAWEKQILYTRWTGDPEKNWMRKSQSERFIEIFQVSKMDAGFSTPEEIEEMRASYSPSMFKARVEGEPVAIASTPVFDIQVLDSMAKYQVRDPLCGVLEIDLEKDDSITPRLLSEASELKFEARNEMPLRVWQKPRKDKQYIVTADTASGLAKKDGDASCAYVMEIIMGEDAKIYVQIVACYHGWIDVFDYAEEVKKLAIWYNDALVIPEYTGGHGEAMLLKLTKELEYTNVFQVETPAKFLANGVQTKYGVDTNVATKETIVICLQKFLHGGRMILPDAEAYKELIAYEQVRSQSGRSNYYEGSQGMHDDRVMSLALGCFACFQSPAAVYFGKEE